MATEVAKSHSHPRVSFEKISGGAKILPTEETSLWKNSMNPTVGHMDFMNQSRKKIHVPWSSNLWKIIACDDIWISWI